MDIEIWGAGTSRTLRPIWVAEELNINYTLHPIGPRTGETNTEEFRALNPKQKIPLLKRGSFLLSESVAICRYLQNLSSSDVLYKPNDSESLAIEDQWCNFIYGELDETSLYVMRRHYDLKNIYGDSPEVVQSCREYFLRQIKVIETVLAKQDNLINAKLSLADILLVTCLDWAIAYDFKLPKNISVYHEKMKLREAYIKAVEINFKK